MTPSVYQQLAARTECDQHRSLERMAPYISAAGDLVPIRVNHAVIGLAGEVGELASLVQKWIYYGKFSKETAPSGMHEPTGVPNDLREQFLLEFGDALWYIAEGLNALGLDMTEVMRRNILKLQVRYPDKYTDWHADEANRDRAKEEAPADPPVRHNTDMDGPAFLEWVADRLVKVHGDPPNVDFVRRLRAMAAEGRALLKTMADVKATIEQDGHGFGHASGAD